MTQIKFSPSEWLPGLDTSIQGTRDTQSIAQTTDMASGFIYLGAPFISARVLQGDSLDAWVLENSA